MNKWSGILLVSLALNAALAVIAFRQSSHELPTENPVVATHPPSPAAMEEKPSAAATAKTFQWSLLESDDLNKYIANLRRFGVSEKIIRDIIMADVAKRYRPQFAALRGQKRVLDEKFWEHPLSLYQPLYKQTREQREQARTLRREQNELVKSLLGADVFAQVAADSGEPDWIENQIGHVPPELSDRVEELVSRYDDAVAALQENNGSDEFTEEDKSKLQRQLHSDLAKILTPEQLREYDLRNSETAARTRSVLKWFEPTEKEFRAVFDFYQTLESMSPQPGDERAARAQRKAAEDALTQALGAPRALEFRLINDPACRNLLNAGVPKETILKFPAIRNHAETAARQITANPSLTPEKRTAAIQAVQAEAQTSLSGLLSEEQLKAYLSEGGWWLRNLSPEAAP